MSKFNCEGNFDIIILAHISLCLLKSQEERIELFRRVYDSLRTGGAFVFNYIDTPINEIIPGEKRPKFFFNSLKKSYVIFSEKISDDKTKSTINVYAEKIDYKGNTSRFIGTSCKYLLTKSIIDDIIRCTNFKRIKDYACNDKEGLIRFEVLEK